MKFRHLDIPRQWTETFTKYPHGLTIFEALVDWTSQVDKMVDNINDWNDYLDDFVNNFEFELQEEVQSTITKWQNEGLLDAIIESALDTELDNVKAQLVETMKDLEEHSVNVRNFRHLIPGVYTLSSLDEGDWTLAIQTAIDYVLENKISKLFFPTGNYNISSPLECYKNGRYIEVEGAGKRDSVITAITEMPYMIKTWEEGIYFSINMSSLGFKMGNKADVGIDAFKSVYSTFDNIAIFGHKENAVLIRLTSWCNKLLNSILHGGYEYGGITPATGLLVESNQATNNLIIEGNLFEALDTSIKVTTYVNDIHIHKNTFDYVGRILLAPRGIKHGSFKYNYCEKCGGSRNAQYTKNPHIYTEGSYERILYSPIVLTEYITMDINYPVNFTIEGNQFANCYKERLVAISCAYDFKFIDNDFLGRELTHTYNNLIYVFGKGVYKGSMYIDQTGTSSKIDNLVEYDNNYAGYYRNNGSITINEPLKNTGITSKPRITPKIGGVEINGDDIIVNQSNNLEIRYNLSSYDKKHPHRVIVNAEGNLIYSLYGDNNDLIYNATLTINQSSNIGVIHQPTETSNKQYTTYLIRLKANDDTKINSVFLEVANAKNKFIQLV